MSRLDSYAGAYRIAMFFTAPPRKRSGREVSYEETADS